MNIQQNRLLTEAQASQYLGISRSFLRHARTAGQFARHSAGPKFHRIGRAVRYSISDLEAFLEERRVAA